MKRKKRWKIGALCLLLCLLFSGCAGHGMPDAKTGESAAGMGNGTDNDEGNDDHAAGGRFLESEVSLPDGVQRLIAMTVLYTGDFAAQRTLAAVGETESSYVFMKSADGGETWETTALDGAEPGIIRTAAIAPDGTVCLCRYADAGEENLLFYDPAGTLKK